jgi:hypothetical protein
MTFKKGEKYLGCGGRRLWRMGILNQDSNKYILK